MQYKFIVLTGVFYSLLFLAGCGNEATAPYAAPNAVQPLAVGNEWTFTDSIFVMDGVSVGTTRIVVSKVTSISPDQLLFDWQVYGGSTLLRTNQIITDARGLWHYGEFVNGDTLHSVKQWAKYPVKIGDTFSEPRYSYSPATGFRYSETWTWRCVSQNYPITLSNGERINCIAFRTIDGSGAETTILYAENIGYSGWITRVNGALVFKETLAAYSLK